MGWFAPNKRPTKPTRNGGNVNGSNVNGIGANFVPGRSPVYRVTVPDNIEPGQEFQVSAGNRIVRVRCPMDCRPGQSLQITVPPETDPPPPVDSPNNTDMSTGSSHAFGNSRREPTLPPDSTNVRRIADSNPPAYIVTIPEGVPAGQQFPVTIQGQTFKVSCPPNALPGMSVRITPPPTPTDVTRPPTDDSNLVRSKSNGLRRNSSDKEKTQLFEVIVPRGVQPGAPFALIAGGVRVLVTCPANAGPGQKIRFKLPLALTQRQPVDDPNNLLKKIRLKYNNDGWERTVRADLKFQWIRWDDKGEVDVTNRFNMEKSAYVRRLIFRTGNDPRFREGDISLVPATESVVDSRIKSTDGKDLVTYSQLAEAQGKNFDDKIVWFQATCAKLVVHWSDGHMRINVRRSNLLEDSLKAVMSLYRKDLRKVWRFEFIGEMGIDAGGLTREWFELVCLEIFDPDKGLWMSSTTNQMSMIINPASGTSRAGRCVECVKSKTERLKC